MQNKYFISKKKVTNKQSYPSRMSFFFFSFQYYSNCYMQTSDATFSHKVLAKNDFISKSDKNELSYSQEDDCSPQCYFNCC